MQNQLEIGREHYRAGSWAEARRWLTRADEETPLDGIDLLALATSAYLVGREEEFRSTLERAHNRWLEIGERSRAARCGFWIGLSLLLGGATGRATGWLGRARRLVGELDCVERGYLLLPAAEQQLAEADCEAALATAEQAASIGERYRDADLVSCARHLQGRALVAGGQVERGMALLDEAMVAVVADELSPIVTGLIYCSVIETCQRAYALDRAREWTAAFAEWCDRQPEMIAFTTTCLVHRSAILRRHGDWQEALEEARRAGDPGPRVIERAPPAAAFYEEGEVHRLRGEFDLAERAYRRASRAGRDPQPGLALLWLARGRTDAASGAIFRALEATGDALDRVPLLSASVEIMLNDGEFEGARAARDELVEIAGNYPAKALEAMAGFATGLLELRNGDARAALVALRAAFGVWQEAQMPHAVARTRGLMGLAFRALGDTDGAALELEAARATFDALGAMTDRAWIDEELRNEPAGLPYGLTPRELEVLRLLTTGRTNRSIASDLSLSEKTVERHVSNLYNKLNVHSRAAATAFAYENNLT